LSQAGGLLRVTLRRGKMMDELEAVLAPLLPVRGES